MHHQLFININTRFHFVAELLFTRERRKINEVRKYSSTLFISPKVLFQFPEEQHTALSGRNWFNKRKSYVRYLKDRKEGLNQLKSCTIFLHNFQINK